MDKELLYKSIDARIESKEEREDGSLHIRFYALAFGNVDSWGDIIAPTACDDFLQSENADRMQLCYQHEMHEVIGKITSKTADAVGLLCEADIIDTTTGKDVQKLIKAGAITEFSIGYYADRFHFERREGYDGDIRVLDAITIIETSPVTRAANPRAVLLDAKSEEGLRALETLSDQQLDEIQAAIANEQARRLFLYM